jgi:hypothetical protein
MSSRGVEDVESQALSEMRRQTSALEGIKALLVFWLIVTLVGAAIGVAYMVQHP